MSLSYSQFVKTNAETEHYRFLMEKSVMITITLMVMDVLLIARDLNPSSDARFLEKALGLFAVTKIPHRSFVEMVELRQVKVNSVTMQTIMTMMDAVESIAESSLCGYAGL